MNPDLKSGRMESGAGGLQELLAIHFLNKKLPFYRSAKFVQNNTFLPVLHLYASLPRTSLLQGNATTGAKGPHSISFVRLHGEETPVPKPD